MNAPVMPGLLKSTLSHSIDWLFNLISVDDDMSMNDTLTILVNGTASIPKITGGMALEQFHDVITEFVAELAKLVVWDSEGITKFIIIKVKVRPREFLDVRPQDVLAM